MKSKRIVAPFLDRNIFSGLAVGDEVLLSGTIYTARDAAHKRIFDAKKAPLELKDQVIYYCGPSQTPRGKVIGSCGPTTSSRMDSFTPFMLSEIKIAATIGKGKRGVKVIDSCVKNKAIYLVAPGGCGALLANSVKKCEVAAFSDLLSEAIYKLEIVDMPLIVGIDVNGNYIYEKL